MQMGGIVGALEHVNKTKGLTAITHKGQLNCAALYLSNSTCTLILDLVVAEIKLCQLLIGVLSEAIGDVCSPFSSSNIHSSLASAILYELISPTAACWEQQCQSSLFCS